MKAKWQYMFQYVPASDPSLKLHVHDMQSEGWEIVSTSVAGMTDYSPDGYPKALLITWKRPNGN